MAKVKLDTSKPNRLHDAAITSFPKDDEGTLVGVMALDTDQGIIPIAINRAAAADLAEKLRTFLAPQ